MLLYLYGPAKLNLNELTLFYQVFEKLGPSLYDFLKRNKYCPFPVELVREFGRQLLESVACVLIILGFFSFMLFKSSVEPLLRIYFCHLFTVIRSHDL